MNSGQNESSCPRDTKHNTVFHEYALSGNLENFKAEFEKLNGKDQSYIFDELSKLNGNDDSALALALENEHFQIASYILTQFNDTEIYQHFDNIDCISREKVDAFSNFLQRNPTPRHNKFYKYLSHAVSGLKRNRHGGDYQLKLLMLFAYVNYENNIQFHLGTDIADGGKFDDLVLRKHNVNGRFEYLCLQAKHAQHLEGNSKDKSKTITINDFLGISSNKDFSFSKYFISFLSLKSNEFRDGSIENLILFTNKSFHKDTEKYFKEIDEEERQARHSIFSDLGGKLYRFDYAKNFQEITNILVPHLNKLNDLQHKIEKPKEINIIKEFSRTVCHFCNQNPEIREYFEKFIFAVAQPSSAILSQKIRKKMDRNKYSGLIFASFREEMAEWFGGRRPDNRAAYISGSQIKHFFKNLKNNFAFIELQGLSSLFKETISKFLKSGLELDYENKNTSYLQNIFQDILKSVDKKVWILIYKENRILLSIGKMYLCLQKQYKDDSKYIIWDVGSLFVLNSDKKKVIRALKSEKMCTLVIYCESIDQKRMDFLKRLSEVYCNSTVKKNIIILLNEKVDQHKQLEQELSLLSSKWKETLDNSLNSFSCESKKIMLNKEIELFGNKIKLEDFAINSKTEEDLCAAIDGDALTTLISDDSITIGSEHKGYGFKTFINIKRTFTHWTRMNKNCLLLKKNNLFAISCTNDKGLRESLPETEEMRYISEDLDKEKPIRYIILGNDNVNENFGKLCRYYENHTIHLLNYEDDKLEWKQTHGSVENLRKYIEESEKSEKIEINDLPDFAIISGEPGIGKSTLLTSYSIETKPQWPIRINLKDYQMHLQEGDFRRLNDVIKFLSVVIDPLNSKTSLITNLLHYSLNQPGKVALLFDEYDEIESGNKERVVQLLKTLRNSKGKILLTTRLYETSSLENALGEFAHTLNPFNVEEGEQEEFLTTFWNERLKEGNDSRQKEKIREFTKQLLEHLDQLDFMKERDLMGRVLQVRMVATIFQDKCREYLKNESFNYLHFRIVNFFDLYERFVKSQFDRYFKEKRTVSDKFCSGEQELIFRSYIKEHEYFALKMLFSNDGVQCLIKDDQCLLLKEQLKSIGLIKDLQNNSARFVHLTYAEYFAAHFFIDRLRKGKDQSKCKAAHKFLVERIFMDKNKVIRTFIEDKIKAENDENLVSEWKTIKGCNLVDVANTHKYFLNLEIAKNRAFNLKNDIESCKKWFCKDALNLEFVRNNDVESIYRLFQHFFKETNIDELKETLKFLLENNEKSVYKNANEAFTSNDNMAKAVAHYLKQIQEQNMFNSEEVVRGYCEKAIETDELSKVKILSSEIENRNAKDCNLELLEELTGHLIPHGKITIEKLNNLSYLFHFLLISYPNAIRSVELYICSEDSIQKKYTKEIINCLENIECEDFKTIQRVLGHGWSLQFLQHFFNSIISHERVAATAKFQINEIFKNNNNTDWLVSKGILICRFLQILTPEIGEKYKPATLNSKQVFYYVIKHFLEILVKTKLPLVDNATFLAMFVKCVTRFPIRLTQLDFTAESFKATMDFVTDTVNKQFQPENVYWLLNFLIALRQCNLLILDVEEELVVLDPTSGFHCKLLCDLVDKVIQLLKWKNNNRNGKMEPFYKKFCELCPVKKNNGKRETLDSDFPSSKRLKTINSSFK